MEIKELTCIGCPLGCSLTATINEDTITVEGNTCPRGEIYAKKELTNPTRIVTSSVRVINGTLPQVSCKTVSDIPKSKIQECMKDLAKITVKAPVSVGDILLENVANTGVAIVATKNIRKVD